MPLNDAKAKPSSFIICLLTALGYLQQNEFYTLYIQTVHTVNSVCVRTVLSTAN